MSTLWRKIHAGRDHRWLQAHASAYVDGELTGRAAQRARDHEDLCPECTRVIRTLRAMLRSIPRALAPAPGSGERAVAEAMRAIGNDRG